MLNLAIQCDNKFSKILPWEKKETFYGQCLTPGTGQPQKSLVSSSSCRTRSLSLQAVGAVSSFSQRTPLICELFGVRHLKKSHEGVTSAVRKLLGK